MFLHDLIGTHAQGNKVNLMLKLIACYVLEQGFFFAPSFKIVSWLDSD